MHLRQAQVKDFEGYRIGPRPPRLRPVEPAWNGNDMDTHADDLAPPVKALNFKPVVHVGHSIGDDEVAR